MTDLFPPTTAELIEYPPRHPLMEGLFQSLPPDGEAMSLEEAANWLQAAAYNLKFAYKFQGRIKVEVE